MRPWFRRVILSRRWATFVLMGFAFFVFGAATTNLFLVLRANLALLSEHGLMAAMDGGAQQLLELLCSGYVGVAAYVVFKTCEHRLVHWLSAEP